MTAALVAAGVVLVVVALLDVAWTTTAAGSGAGPLTGRSTGAIWRLALAWHRRRPSHARLSAAGVVIVFSVLAVWILLVLLGWTLVFTSAEGAVRLTDTDEPADLLGRLYFVGYSVFTLGNGDYAPGQGTWQMATVAATGTGLILVTLSITYMVPVASAVAQRRHLASYVAALGRTASEILTRSWTDAGFGSLSQHLVSLTPLVLSARQHHLTYPVLHYFHSRDDESAAAQGIANLSGALHLVRHGVAADARPDPAATAALDAGIGAFLETLANAFIHVGEDSLPAPPLDELRRAGVPVVDEATYRRAAAGTERRRRLLAAFLRNDGWTPAEASAR